MTVKQLIAELKKYPDDILVECPWDDWGGFKLMRSRKGERNGN